MSGQATPRCVLVAEDESLLAMLVEDVLSDAGYRVLKAARLPAALALAGSEHLDAAILDINLDGTAVFPVAEALRALGVPFLFASGYGQAGIPDEFHGVPVLQKPYLPATLHRAVADLLGE